MYSLDSGKDENKRFEDLESRPMWLDSGSRSQQFLSPALNMQTFHNVTDWYNAYVSSRVTELPYRPHIIFVDGHCTQLCVGRIMGAPSHHQGVHSRPSDIFSAISKMENLRYLAQVKRRQGSTIFSLA
ncbi:uncharacterized protein LOC115667469 [Syzygium oleosum]|uniref:uncharacterized protein LOC115667469 n=1 Tax=Syzygium oleosum TaxID=219896 RepID=UPI0024BA0B09|nr:uncharacterized protein LOC115667469 [Syzygium oleosum]